MCDMNAIETHVTTVAFTSAAAGSGAAPELGGVLRLLADPALRETYLMVCFALLVLPMIALALWYHARIGRSEGGARLMQRQNARTLHTKGSINEAYRNLDEAAALAGGIESGAYGEDAKALQHKVYWFTGAWLLVNTIAFGVLIWADEANRAALP